MGRRIDTVGKISTGIQGLDKMLLGGLQLPLIRSGEDVASSEKGIIIVLKGDRGTDKTLFAMQMMHGIAKSLNNLEVKPKAPSFYSLDKKTDQMNDMLLDFIISKCIDKMIRTRKNDEWTGSRFADAIFDTSKIRAGATQSSTPPPFPENLKSKIDSYISEGIVFYNIRTNSLHFKTAQSIDSQANILFTRRYDNISDYQKVSNAFSSEGNFDFRNDFFEVQFNEHIPTDNGNKDSRKEMEYKYVTTPSHTFSKILSHIQKGAEDNSKNNSMPSSCIVIDGLTKISDSDLRSFELTPFEHILRKSALVTIIVIDDLDEKLKISADILIELGRVENNKENYTSHALRICKSVFQMYAYGWHEYKKRDYGIEVYPSSHLQLQQKRYLPQAKILVQLGILDNHYVRHVSAKVSGDVKDHVRLKEYDDYKRMENTSMDVLRNLYFKKRSKTITTVGEALQELFGYENNNTFGKIIAILGSPNSFKFYLAAGSCFCASKQGIHTLFLTFDRLIDNLRDHIMCPAWNTLGEKMCVPCFNDLSDSKISKKYTDEYSCTANCSRHCKLSECNRCYSNMHSFNINMGCISTDELLHYLNEQLDICFNKDAHQKIRRIIIDDLQKIDYSFPFLKGNDLFLSAIKNYCQQKCIDLIILCDKNAGLARCLRSLADNVICMERNEEAKSLSIYIEKFSGITPPSHILKEGIMVDKIEEGKSIYDIFECQESSCVIKFESNATPTSFKDFWKE
ncbi:hypothetical protein JQM96_12210 [Bacteroides uniformis]|nr:hypothetical protein [Bacteroides uniformis]